MGLWRFQKNTDWSKEPEATKFELGAHATEVTPLVWKTHLPLTLASQVPRAHTWKRQSSKFGIYSNGRMETSKE
jgi:hypothetical protein